MSSEALPNDEIGVCHRAPKKTYIEVPAPETRGRGQRLRRASAQVALAPLYWLLAHLYRGPGLQFRWRCAILGMHLLCRPNTPVPYSTIVMLLFWPIDSVRYFEFDFMWRALLEASFHNYLDISSPRLFPIMLLRKHPDVDAELVNPDKADLRSTATLVDACGSWFSVSLTRLRD